MMCRGPSISSFFALLLSPVGPVILTTGMALLLRSSFGSQATASNHLGAWRLIRDHHDAGAERLGRHQVHPYLVSIVSLAKQPFATAHKERKDPKLELIEQSRREQLSREQTVAVNDQIFAVLLLELCRFGRDVAGGDGRMVPVRPLQAVGEDVLLHLVDAAAVVTYPSCVVASIAKGDSRTLTEASNIRKRTRDHSGRDRPR